MAARRFAFSTVAVGTKEEAMEVMSDGYST
jgi:hypothetical protein